MWFKQHNMILGIIGLQPRQSLPRILYLGPVPIYDEESISLPQPIYN
jgi:hypothetical protein